MASFWGLPGARGSKDLYHRNEQRWKKVLAAGATVGDVPYFICADGNVQPQESVILRQALGTKHWCDVADYLSAERHASDKPLPTFGPADWDCKAESVGTSRIDCTGSS